MTRRFAQIQDEKAHWVFESDEKPKFAPYVEIMDVTDRTPTVREGDVYDRQTDSFQQRELESGPTVGVKEVGVGNFNLLFFPDAGDAQQPHRHATGQRFWLVRGAIELHRGALVTHHTAQDTFFVPAGVVHYSVAEADKTLMASSFIDN